MASAAITIVENPATVESDSSEAVITKDTSLKNMCGFLQNVGTTDVWLKVSVTDTAAATVVTTGAQAQNQVPLPAGGVFPWLKHYKSVAHKTAGGTSTLAWVPSHNGRGGV
jgi:hypothetical protein